jgi:hypothetical protein
MDAAYFRDVESDAIYACLGPMGGTAIFRLYEGVREWEFLIPESPTWDDAHQRIYRNFRVTALRADELSTPLPPLPPIPRGPFPEWKEYFLPKGALLRVSEYPTVARLFKERNASAVTLFVVLVEDVYETAFGDGEFHYFDDVHLFEEDATRDMESKKQEWQRFHLRPVTIALEGETIGFPDWRPMLFDRYEPAKVLSALETRLRG